MAVSGQLHVPADLLPGKEPPVPIGKKAAWARSPPGRFEEKNLVLPGIEPGPSSPNLSLYQLSYPDSLNYPFRM
jgi:hypothetical protein